MCEPLADRECNECESENDESGRRQPAHESPLTNRADYHGAVERGSNAVWRGERMPTVLNTATMKWPLSSFSVLTALALAVPPTALAQSRALQQRIQAATRVECTFTTVATGGWEGTAPQASVAPAEHEALFTEINVDEGTAESTSVYGDTFISVRYAAGYLHFMQISDVGPLFVTTIFPRETANGRLKAVQVRLEYAATTLPGFASRPEMFLGDCAVTS